MPTSDHRQVSPVLDLLIALQPASILDIGVGFGKYGTLAREYLPDAALVGVEPWEDYRDDAAVSADRWWAYDDVILAPWPEPAALAANAMGHSVALMIDVLEHYNKRDGRYALRAALDCAERVIVATPLDAMQWPQDDHPNPYERHRRSWTITDVQHATGQVVRDICRLPDSWIGVLRA